MYDAGCFQLRWGLDWQVCDCSWSIADDYAPPKSKAKWLAAFYLCIPVGYALVRRPCEDVQRRISIFASRICKLFRSLLMLQRRDEGWHVYKVTAS